MRRRLGAGLAVLGAAGAVIWLGSLFAGTDEVRLITTTGDAAHFGCDLLSSSAPPASVPSGWRLDQGQGPLRLAAACALLVQAREQGACLLVPDATRERCKPTLGADAPLRAVLLLVEAASAPSAPAIARVRQFDPEGSLAQATKPPLALASHSMSAAGLANRQREMPAVVPPDGTKFADAMACMPALNPAAAMVGLAAIPNAASTQVTCSAVFVRSSSNSGSATKLLTAKHCLKDVVLFDGSKPLECVSHESLDLAVCTVDSRSSEQIVSVPPKAGASVPVTLAGFGRSYRGDPNNGNVYAGFCAGAATYQQVDCKDIKDSMVTKDASEKEVVATHADSGGAVFHGEGSHRRLVGIIVGQLNGTRSQFVDLRMNTARNFLAGQKVAVGDHCKP